MAQRAFKMRAVPSLCENGNELKEDFPYQWSKQTDKKSGSSKRSDTYMCKSSWVEEF